MTLSRDALWGYLSQGLQYGAALLVLPLLLRSLTGPELGIWYVFLAIASFASLLDFGFTPTLARNVSYVSSGSRHLLAHGYEVVEEGGSVDYDLLDGVITTSRSFYAYLALATLVVLATVGTLYIESISGPLENKMSLWLSWGLFVAATVLQLYFKYFTPILQGRGLFVEYYKATALSNLAFIAATALLLLMGLGLFAVSFGYLTSALVGRQLSWYYLRNQEFYAELRSASWRGNRSDLFRILFHNAWRMGVGVLGAFLILRANTMLASSYLGLEVTATYALSLQITTAVQSMALVVVSVQLPRLTQLRIAGNLEEMRALLIRTGAQSVAFHLLGVAALVAAGSPLIRLIGGNSDLLPRDLLAWIGLMSLLELIHTIAASIILTGNRVPFIGAALVSGLLILASSWVGLSHYGQSVAWLIGCQFAVQLAYNNWYWPWYVMRELRR